MHCLHSYVHLNKKVKGNYFHLPKVTALLLVSNSHWETDIPHTLVLGMGMSILLDLDHEDRWLLKRSRLKKLAPSCMVIGGGRKDDDVLCCPSPLGQYLLRACSFPAVPCLNINCLKLNAHKCDLFPRSTAVCGYASTSYVWMSFWNHLCPVQQWSRWKACRNPDLRLMGLPWDGGDLRVPRFPGFIALFPWESNLGF